MHTDIQGNSLLSGFTVLGFPFQELQRSSQAFLVCLFYSRNTNIYDSARSLILLLTSSYWLTMFFQKLKRDLSYSKAFACGNKHCCFPAASSAATQLPFKPSVMRSVCRKSMLNARALSFLLTFCSLSQHLEFKCFNQCPGSALFSWKMVFSSPEAYNIYKTTSGFFTKDGRQSYSVWCLGKKKRKQMLLNYTKWIECEGRTHLSRVQTTRDRDRTLLTMQLLQDVPSPQQWKGTEMQLSGMLSSILTTFITSTRKHTIKMET